MRLKFVRGFSVLLSLLAVALLNACLAAAQPGAAQELNSPVGLWQATDQQTGEPTGWFLISEQDGVYNGIIAKMFLKPGQKPDVVCDKCRGDRHDQPWLGLQIIRGMKPEGERVYGNGTILDPRDGNVYDAQMKLAPDGQTLIVRGYIGISLLGRNQYWTRLPNSDIGQLAPPIRAQAQAQLDTAADPPQR